MHCSYDAQALAAADVTLTLSQVDEAGATLNRQFICDDGITICGGYDPISSEVFPDAVYPATATYLKFVHLGLDVRVFYFAPIAPFDGRVYFPLTQNTFAAADTTTTLGNRFPAAAMDAAANQCFLRAAQVCVNNHDLQNGPIKCVTTGADGRYVSAAQAESFQL